MEWDYLKKQQQKQKLEYSSLHSYSIIDATDDNLRNADHPVLTPPRVSPQVNVPALSASTPARRDKSFDPTELPISQRMSKMAEKLGSVVASPAAGQRESEPTQHTVGARMSAWENMTCDNNKVAC